MNTEETIQILSEREGWTIHESDMGTFWWNDELNKTLPPDDDGMRQPIDYLNSHDAIRGVILKLTPEEWAILLHKLHKHHQQSCDNVQPHYHFKFLLTLTASELAPMVAQAIKETKK